MIVGLYGVSLCLLMPSVLCIGGFGELGELELYENDKLQHHLLLKQVFVILPVVAVCKVVHL